MNCTITCIISMQEHEAEPALELLEESTVAAVEYLREWDMGDSDETFQDNTEGFPELRKLIGMASKYHRVGNYIQQISLLKISR